jgi:hypothetical protein
MSLNSFIASTLEKYDEWDRLAEKFGILCIEDEVLMAILNGLEGDQIAKIARDCGTRIPKAVMEFWFSQVTPEIFLKFLRLRSRYQRFVNHVVDVGNEGQLVITARHKYGKKWSLWSSSYIAEAIKANFGLTCQIEIDENTFRIECSHFAKSVV